MSTIPNETMDAYFAAWQERNDAARAKLVEKAWAQDGTYEDADVSLSGRDAIAAYIGAALAVTPGRVLSRGERLEGSGGASAFTWSLALPDGTSRSGYASAKTDGEGRLESVRSWQSPVAGEGAKSLIERMRSWSLATWLQALGAAAIVAYVLLRAPAEIFYDRFDAAPEDVGFGDVGAVVRQYMRMIGMWIISGLTWSVLFLAITYSIVATLLLHQRLRRHGFPLRGLAGMALAVAGLPLLLDALQDGGWRGGALGAVLLTASALVPRTIQRSGPELRDIHRQFLSWAGHVFVIGALGFGTLFYVLIGLGSAAIDARAVKDGTFTDPGLLSPVPWRPRPVEVVWTKDKPPMTLPDCTGLVYLGQGDKRLLLYDRTGDRTVRISHGDVELSFPDDC